MRMIRNAIIGRAISRANVVALEPDRDEGAALFENQLNIKLI